jgi:hypothetical protein
MHNLKSLYNFGKSDFYFNFKCYKILENFKILQQLSYKMKFRNIFHTLSAQENAHAGAQWSTTLTKQNLSHPSRTHSGQALHKC